MPEEFVKRAVTLLVTNFMPLKPADLEGWMADPEEWVNSEEKEDEQWTFEIRVYIHFYLSRKAPVNPTPSHALSASL